MEDARWNTQWNAMIVVVFCLGVAGCAPGTAGTAGLGESLCDEAVDHLATCGVTGDPTQIGACTPTMQQQASKILAAPCDEITTRSTFFTRGCSGLNIFSYFNPSCWKGGWDDGDEEAWQNKQDQKYGTWDEDGNRYWPDEEDPGPRGLHAECGWMYGMFCGPGLKCKNAWSNSTGYCAWKNGHSCGDNYDCHSGNCKGGKCASMSWW